MVSVEGYARAEVLPVLDHPEALLSSVRKCCPPKTQASEMLGYKHALLNRPKRSFQTHRFKKKKAPKGKVSKC